MTCCNDVSATSLNAPPGAVAAYLTPGTTTVLRAAVPAGTVLELADRGTAVVTATVGVADGDETVWTLDPATTDAAIQAGARHVRLLSPAGDVLAAGPVVVLSGWDSPGARVAVATPPTTGVELNGGPGAVTAHVVRGSSASFAVAGLTSGSLQFGARGQVLLEVAGTPATDGVTWTLTAEQVDDLLAGGVTGVRVCAGAGPTATILYAGPVVRLDGWTGETSSHQTIVRYVAPSLPELGGSVPPHTHVHEDVVDFSAAVAAEVDMLDLTLLYRAATA